MKLKVGDKPETCPKCGGQLLWELVSCEQAIQICSNYLQPSSEGYIMVSNNPTCDYQSEPEDQFIVQKLLNESNKQLRTANERIAELEKIVEFTQFRVDCEYCACADDCLEKIGQERNCYKYFKDKSEADNG